MVKEVKLVLGMYHSSPSWLTREEGEEAYNSVYKPLLSFLYNNPEISMTLYISASYIERLEKINSGSQQVIKEMIKRKQLEILGGGVNEPIFSILPVADRINQLEKMTTAITKRFGKRPKGVWLPYGFWKSSLITTLNSCNHFFTLLDWRQMQVSCSEGPRFSPWLTEELGKTLYILPLHNNYLEEIPHLAPDEFIEKIVHECPHDGVVSLFLSSAKVAELLKGDSESSPCWLKQCLKYAARKREVSLFLPTNVIKYSITPIPRGYFYETSYNCFSREAGQKQKSLRPDKPLQHFLVKYNESNRLYSKMLYVNVLINQLKGDRSRKETAKEELGKAQENSPYWYAPHGGIYLAERRQEAYSRLLEAERMIKKVELHIPAITEIDYNMDGYKEFLYHGNYLNAYVHPKGGTLIELDYLPIFWNYLNSFSRYNESWHTSDFEGADIYPRTAFIDHFLTDETDIEDIVNGPVEGESRFHSDVYEVVENNHVKIRFIKRDNVKVGAKKYMVELSKTYFFKERSVEVRYGITNRSVWSGEFRFASEINLNFSSESEEKHSIEIEREEKSITIPLKAKSYTNVPAVSIHDKVHKRLLSLSFSLPSHKLGVAPFYTNVMVDSEVKKLYQASTFLPSWTFNLESGETFEFLIKLSIDKMK